ncbi:PKD domain-containing protein [Haloarcula pellucida]|uniref:CARDB domain-containing protein n=1 Tax=Haloarcula pellucida TaxID=1427151 RepID=A0A830GP60_9EURY|nr:CARDB domain-containing protein [Halomicroarcula pellucida]MBX0349777.1 hypothetical protein [Halomicroarcula pellucida]GGN94259.1 hypothetical protein GCM10009030_20480 [Halomicroarcula pellucida]
MTSHGLTNPSRSQVLSLLLATIVVLGTTAGLASAATTTDLTVSITDSDNTIAPDENTTVQIGVANADDGVGAAELGVELSDPGVATITDVTVLHTPGVTDNNITGGGAAADVKYAFADSPDTGAVTMVEVTLQGAAAGSTDVNVVQNSQTGNLVVFDENGSGYTLNNVGSATLTVEEVNVPPTADAGADQTVTSGDTVTLDGTNSTDPDGTLNYSWTETTSSGVTLSGADTATPTFTAPDVNSETTLTFDLTVTDDDGASDSDLVNVTVQPPDAANFQVSNLQAPASATQGDTIDVSADVENTGGQADTKAVEFRVDTDGDDSIADESAVASQDVQLDAGASTTVEFTDIDTSGFSTGTVTHGVVTPDDTATATITIEEPPTKQTTVSLQPTDQTTAVGIGTTYDVVVDDAQGGVGAAELRIAVDNTTAAEITGASVADDSATEEIEIAADGSWVDLEYAFADTADTGSVVVATVSVEGVNAGTANLSLEPTDTNSEVLVFDESGQGYDVTGTNGASLDVQAVQFLVSDLSAPDKAAVGSTMTVTANVTNDGSVESTQPVEFRIDADGDGDLETVVTKQETIAAGATDQVTFTFSVPSDADFGPRQYGVFTAADNETAEIEFTPPDVNGDGLLPGDPDDDGLYEDVNGDGSVDVGDAQALFSNRDSAAVQNYVASYDFNGDGVINVGDAQALFSEVTA